MKIANPKTREAVAHMIEGMLRVSDLSKPLRRVILRNMLRIVSRHDDDGVPIKYYGQPYWSQRAIDQYMGALQAGQFEFQAGGKLVVEPVVSMREILQKILDGDQTAEGILEILNTYYHCVVLTGHESSMLRQRWHGYRLSEEQLDGTSDEFLFSKFTRIGIRVVEGLERRIPKS